MRGRYLVTDAAVQSAGSFVTFLISAACLAGDTRPWQFSTLFAFSAITGAISLSFLKRIPDAEMPEETLNRSRTRVPWLAMVKHPPYAKLLRLVACYSVAYGGMTAFTVDFLKAQLDLPESTILLLVSTSFLGGLASLWLMGSRFDRWGSKPVLTFAFAAWLLVLSAWIALASGLTPLRLWLVILLQVAMGLLAVLVQMSNTRLAMAVIPVMGRNHFFALYSVANNVILGLAPVGWGLAIDMVGARHPVFLGITWNRFTIFFAGACAAFTASLVLARRLVEPQAASFNQMLKELIVQAPLRFWVRFWARG